MNAKSDKPDSSEVIVSKYATTFVGKDAIDLFRAATLASGLRLYGKTKMRLTRHVSGPDMLKLAQRYTGKTYKRGEYELAATDVDKWVAVMRGALPIHLEGDKA